MNREQQEMALWRRVFERWYAREDYEIDVCGNLADSAVAEFRKRYPVEPDATPATAPEAVWYDEPPFSRLVSKNHPCWIEGYTLPGFVYWNGEYWRMYVAGDLQTQPLNGRRVSPIAKPQEPTT